MALFSMRIQQIKRSKGRSPVAAAAYRAAECLYDPRLDRTYDYTQKRDVVHKEIIVPDNAPAWAHRLDRGALWAMADKAERRRDAQTAREVRIMLPRELDPATRISLAREFVKANFVDLGMIADLTIHCPRASDGQEQPHAHVMLTMRHLTEEGFGLKSRHDWVPDPEGRTHPDGRPVMIASNARSWNLASSYEECRASFERLANDALQRAGSTARISRLSYLERGLSKLSEPYLGVALHMKALHGVMAERFGQFQVARHYRAVEARAKAAFARFEESPSRMGDRVRTARRFLDWFDRMAEALAPARDGPDRGPSHAHGMDRR